MRLVALIALGMIAGAACKKDAPAGVLAAADLSTANESGPFDPNEIVDTPSFTDYLGLDETEVQTFLDHTPYGPPSFLATYQSNGVLAATAIVRAAVTYRLNPLVFLVRAEMAQGLVAAENYPIPPVRVEYVFGCGIIAPGQYDPAEAGFDRQVACLGAALRASLDQIAASGATAGGWGPNTQNVTLDGVAVTPADEATAALYQYEPLVDVGTGGNWLFWNIWQEYANAANYAGPVGGGPTGMAAIGDACGTASDCVDPGAICATGANYPGGMCTLPCTGTCSTDTVQTFCADFQSSGYCLAVCDPTAPTPCRQGYMCISVHQFGNSDPNAAQNVCFAP